MSTTTISPHRISGRISQGQLRAFFKDHEPHAIGMTEQVPLPTSHVQLKGGEALTNNFAKQSLFVGFERIHGTPFFLVHLEREPESSDLAIKLIDKLGVEFYYRNNDLSLFGLEAPYEAEISRYSLDQVPEVLVNLAEDHDVRIIVNDKPTTFNKVYQAYGGKADGPKDGPTLFYWASINTLKLALAEGLKEE